MISRLNNLQFHRFCLYRVKIDGIPRTFFHSILIRSTHRLPLALCIFIVHLPALRYAASSPRSIIIPIYGSTGNSRFGRELVGYPFGSSLFGPPMVIGYGTVILIFRHQTVIDSEMDFTLCEASTLLSEASVAGIVGRDALNSCGNHTAIAPAPRCAQA